MGKRKFSKEFMLEDVLEGTDIVRDEVVGKRRWSVDHELIFRFEGKLYRAHYSVGATEQQDEGPFENSPDEIECDEVEAYEKTVTDYRKVSP